ncbi:MAG: DUF3419 family protein [Micromonosporaceae bacterium]
MATGTAPDQDHRSVYADPAGRRSGGRIPLLALGSYRASAEERQWLTKGAVLYSSCDEDSFSELNGLRVGPDDDVLSITGSGCRSLNLLLGGPRSVVSVDGNPLQNHLLELKIAGIRAYDHEDFVTLLGLFGPPGDERVDRYDQIRTDLPEPARRFWDGNRHVLRKGVIYSGAHERFYARYIGPAIRILRRGRLRELYQFDDLDAQREFYSTKWDHAGWRTAVRALAQPWLVRALLNDPSYFLQVDRDSSVADYLLARLRNVFGSHLARDNHLFTLLVHGRYLHPEGVPPYLSAKHYGAIRQHIDAIEVVTERVDQFLQRQPDARFSGFSLSDISGWTSPAEFAGILGEVARVAKPGGRLCYRNFLTERPLPDELTDRLRPLPDVSEELTQQDSAFAFTFVVAERVADPAEGGSR